MNKKFAVGDLIFVRVFQARLRLITAENTSADEGIQLFTNNRGSTTELEANFFKLMHFLTKNCPKNYPKIKEMKPLLEAYVDNIKQESMVGRQDIVKKID